MATLASIPIWIMGSQKADIRRYDVFLLSTCHFNQHTALGGGITRTRFQGIFLSPLHLNMFLPFFSKRSTSKQLYPRKGGGGGKGGKGEVLLLGSSRKR